MVDWKNLNPATLIIVTFAIFAVVATVALLTRQNTVVYYAQPSQPSMVEIPLQQVELVEEQSPTPVLIEEALHVHDDGSLHDHELTEQDLMLSLYQEFWEKATGYSYKIDCGVHGRMSVSVKEDIVTYRSLDTYFFYDEENNVVHTSNFSTDIGGCLKDDKDTWTPLTQSFYKDLKKGNLKVLNYVIFDVEANHYTGCFIIAGSNLNDCVENNSGSPIIYDNFTFMHPKSPLDYLLDFQETEPFRVVENNEIRTRTGENKIVVDEYFFTTTEGSYSRLYVHDYYRIPIQIDETEGRTTTGIHFDDMRITPRTILR